MKLKYILKSDAATIVASAALTIGPLVGTYAHSAYQYATSEKASNGSAQVIFYPDGNVFKNFRDDDLSFSIDCDKDGVLDERQTFIHGQRCVSFIHRQAPFERHQKEYAELLRADNFF